MVTWLANFGKRPYLHAWSVKWCKKVIQSGHLKACAIIAWFQLIQQKAKRKTQPVFTRICKRETPVFHTKFISRNEQWQKVGTLDVIRQHRKYTLGKGSARKKKWKKKNKEEKKEKVHEKPSHRLPQTPQRNQLCLAQWRGRAGPASSPWSLGAARQWGCKGRHSKLD